MAIQNTIYLDIDIKTETYAKIPPVTQNDEVTFVIRVTDGGVPFPLADVSTHALVSKRSDGESVLTNGTLTGTNEVTFALGTTEISVPGKVRATVQFYDAGGRVSTRKFDYKVESDDSTGYIPSADEQTLIELVLGDGPAILQASETATAQTNEFLANNVRIGEYDTVAIYKKGNEVGYDGSSYVALQDTQGNLPTDTTYWALRARKGLGDVNSVNGIFPVNGDVELPIPDLTETTSRISNLFNLTPSVVKFPVHESWRAAQGVTTDGTFIYTFTDRTVDFNLENIITVYTMDGKYVSEKRLAYTGLDPQGKFMSFGDGNIIDGFIYATVYNLNGGGNPLISRVVKFNINDLSINQVYEIGGQTAESVTKHDNHFWTVYHDVNAVRKFDLNFNFIQEYPLTVGTTPHGGFQGSLWEGEYFYANLHGHNWNSDPNPFAELRKYYFDGTDFNYIESISPPTNGCSQGLSKYSDYYLWNDRPNHSIVISKSLKRGKIYAETQPYNHSDSFKPNLLNGWEILDTSFDRVARVTKTNDGAILLSGIIKPSASAIFGSNLNPIFKIPLIYTPKYSTNFVALSNNGIIRLAIVGKNSSSGAGEEGNVIPYNIMNLTDIQWISLDGINYPILNY